MPNVILTNKSKQSSGHDFSAVWLLSRAMLKAGWQYLGSGDGTNVDKTSFNPASDRWRNNGPSQGSGSAATISSVSNTTDMTLTGLSGLSSSDVGRFMTITGAANTNNNFTCQIIRYISTTSVVVRNNNPAGAPNASDANNGSISWDIRDPVLETYPTALDSVRAWICLRGPSTARLKITSAPGTFIRGESVTQAISGATGRILGVTYNASGPDGYAIISPRTGIFNASNVVTGSSSGATLTPTEANIFTVECVFYKIASNQTGGGFYLQCCNESTESAQRL